MNRLSIRNILVSTDFSKMSIRVIEPANWLAGRFAASIHLVHVREPAYPTGFVAAAPPFSVMTYEQEAKQRVAGDLNALAYKYGVPAARCHVLCGTAPFNEICRLAGKIRADLIVMPTHGRTGLEYMFLGQHRRTNRAALAVSGVYHAAAGQRPVRKEGWLQKDSCAGRFLRLLTRRTPVRDHIRGTLWGEIDSAACD
jgi:nucleotide-binding universal stress UspA family protein